MDTDLTDLPSSDQRVADALKALRSMQHSGTPIAITTQSASYEQCLLLNVDVKFTRTGSAALSQECHEIFIMTKQTTSGLKVPSRGK